MRRLLTIVLLLLLPARQAAAQWDTAGLRMDHFATTPALVSAGLGAAGSVLTFVPAANRLAVAVRDEVVAAEPEVILVGRAIVDSVAPAHAAADLREHMMRLR